MSTIASRYFRVVVQQPQTTFDGEAFTSSSNNFKKPGLLAMTSATNGSEIYYNYTTGQDASSPSKPLKNSKLYTEPIALDWGTHKFNVITYKDDLASENRSFTIDVFADEPVLKADGVQQTSSTIYYNNPIKLSIEGPADYPDAEIYYGFLGQ